jgi:hypothetical protein
MLSDSSKEKRTKKTKRKINWSEYNESLVRRGEMLFDSAADSTGIKVTNRGEWMLDKWKKKRKRKDLSKFMLL